jgi:hypothetical protein
MSTKLTLTIQKDVIDRAKQYAKSQNRSLSFLIENYLKSITEKETDQEELLPVVKALKGSFKLDKDLDYRKELDQRLENKYL